MENLSKRIDVMPIPREVSARGLNRAFSGDSDACAKFLPKLVSGTTVYDGEKYNSFIKRIHNENRLLTGRTVAHPTPAPAPIPLPGRGNTFATNACLPCFWVALVLQVTMRF